MSATEAARPPWDDPGAAPFLRVTGLRKTFGDVTAVDTVSLDIFKGEFFALLGPSGCGKTTLLRMLAGFETPDAGTIALDGEDMTAVPPYERPVNMMFQSYALFPHMTVEGNIAFGLKQDRIAKAEIARRVADVMALVELDGLAARMPDRLSGGQRQRVALARALVKRPNLLLLDEPLAALDKKLRERTRFELMNIQHQVGITFVIVTHDQEEAMTLATRIAVMDAGRIRQLATPAQLYEQPQSRAVAEFIGDVNVFEGKVRDTGAAGTTVACADAGCAIRAGGDAGLAVGATAWIAIRPEKFQVRTTAPQDRAVNCLAGEVTEVAYLGNLSIYHVRLAGGRIVTATMTNQIRTNRRPVSVGDKVFLTWPPEAAVALKE